MEMVLSFQINSLLSFEDYTKHNIQVIAIFLEDHVAIGEFRTGSPETDFLVVCVADDVTVEDDIWVVQGWLHFHPELFEELNLGVFQTMEIPDALRVNEGYMLLLAIVNPEDEIWIEVAGFKESDAFAAFVSKKVKVFALQTIIFMCLIVSTNMLNKGAFSCIQCHW